MMAAERPDWLQSCWANALAGCGSGRWWTASYSILESVLSKYFI